jgi:hypothetical protein
LTAVTTEEQVTPRLTLVSEETVVTLRVARRLMSFGATGLSPQDPAREQTLEQFPRLS